MSTITPKDKVAFEANGFHVLRAAVSANEIARLKEALARMLLTPAVHPYAKNLADAPEIATSPPDNPRGVWAAFNLQLFDDIFWDFAYHPAIALAVDALIGADINLYETASIHKVPGFPNNYRDWHQDSEYSDPQSDDRNVTVITFLDEMDGESGATWVVPGSHKQGALPHILPSENLSSKAKEVKDKHLYAPNGVAFSYQPGDVLIFLVRVVHKSGANLSGELKSSIAYNYCSRSTLDLARINGFVGAYLPITRNGAIYRPGAPFLNEAKP